jgi:hypothetical protein
VSRAWIVFAVTTIAAVAVIAVSANVIGHGHDSQAVDEGDEGYMPPRPPERDDPLDRLIWEAEVLAPRRYGGLTLYPIELARGSSEFRPRTLDEAIDRGDLIVREIGEGRVNEVHVRNRGSQPVFILSGEIMTGSKQDRISSADVLVPPRSGWIVLEVYCVEHGRWTKTSEDFGTKRSLANAGIRQMAQAAAPQTEVWENVAEKARSVGVEQSERGAFNEIYDAESVQSRLAPYRKKLRPIVTSRTAGMAAVVGRRVIAVDLFANPSLLRALWEKLLDSYALDALAQESRGLGYEPDERDIQRMLRQAASDRASRHKRRTPGIGRLFEIRSDAIEGFMLTHRDEVVHANVFESRYRILEHEPQRVVPEEAD